MQTDNNLEYQQHPEQRVAILMDIQNMYYSAKELHNSKVNFANVLKKSINGRKLVRAIAYTIKTDIKEESHFHAALTRTGIEVKMKDIQIFEGGGKKGDWDIGLAMDAVRLSKKIDTIILCSGDGDFSDLLKYLKSVGCRVEVLAFGKTCSSNLLNETDGFINMSESPDQFLIPIANKQKNNHQKNGEQKNGEQKQQKKPAQKKDSQKKEPDTEGTTQEEIDEKAGFSLSKLIGRKGK